MSIKERLKQQQDEHGIFAVVGGLRLDGKTTLAGTLPGKSILLQGGVIETGSSSAMAKAAELGNDLITLSFTSYDDIMKILKDPELLDYDNIYIDGISAINEMRYECDDVQKAQKKTIWEAFRIIGDDLRSFLKSAKMLSVLNGKNVFVTLAYKETLDANGNIAKIAPDVKGNVTISEIQRLCPIVLAVRKKFNDSGKVIGRELVTSSDDIYPARVDSLLDGTNPGVIDGSLTSLINLLK